MTAPAVRDPLAEVAALRLASLPSWPDLSRRVLVDHRAVETLAERLPEWTTLRNVDGVVQAAVADPAPGSWVTLDPFRTGRLAGHVAELCRYDHTAGGILRIAELPPQASRALLLRLAATLPRQSAATIPSGYSLTGGRALAPAPDPGTLPVEQYPTQLVPSGGGGRTWEPDADLGRGWDPAFTDPDAPAPVASGRNRFLDGEGTGMRAGDGA
jgi:hypothetical protein